MADKKLEDLQVTWEEMLATCVDLGITVPEDLELPFTTLEVGQATCASLHKLITEFKAGVDTRDESTASETDPPRKRKKRASKPSPSSAPTTTTEENDEVTTTTTAKKSSAKKAAKAPAKKAAKTAKKAVAKKPAAKKAAKSAANGAKKPSTADKKARMERDARGSKLAAAAKNGGAHYPADAKITLLVKPMPDFRKGTKWYDRISRVYAAGGKKVSEFKGKTADLTRAIQLELIKVG